MAHFAKVEGGKVTNVIAVSNDDCGGGDLPESEEAGQAFIAGLGFEGEWFQTSYNKNFRGQFAGIGMSYDYDLGVFHTPSPYPSWTLGPDGAWSPPVPMPEGAVSWDEENQVWV